MSRSIKKNCYVTYLGNSNKIAKRKNNRVLRRRTKEMIASACDIEAISLPYKLADVMNRCDYPDDDSRHRTTIAKILSWGGKPWQYIGK